MSGAVSGAAAGATAGSLAGPIGSAVGAIGGALVGAIGSNASSKKQFKYQSALQRQAAKLNYDYSLKSAQNLPSSTRQGLEAAGYNPMLAVQNSTSGANSSWTSSGSSTAPDYAGAISSGISSGVANAQSYQRLLNETATAESSSDASYAAADKAKAEKAEITARLPFVPERQRKEIVKLEADTQLIEAQKHNLKERLDLDRQLGFAGIDANLYGSNVQRDKNLVELEKVIRYNEWAKKHPWLASVSETAERHPELLRYGRDYLNSKYRYDDYDEYYGYTYDLKGRRDGYRKSRRKR